VEEGFIERFIGLDMSDGDTVFDRCLDACHRVRKELGDLDGVTCFCELAMPLASRLAERLGLATNSPAAVDAARDKHATRACMEEAGLPTPRNMLITAADMLPRVGRRVGWQRGRGQMAGRGVWAWRGACGWGVARGDMAALHKPLLAAGGRPGSGTERACPARCWRRSAG
jgi:hypothetical protein